MWERGWEISEKPGGWRREGAGSRSLPPPTATNSGKGRCCPATFAGLPVLWRVNMPRLLGVDIPNDKLTFIALRYLYGVGDKVALELCHKAGVDPQKHARELAEEELSRLAVLLDRDYT